MWVLFSYPQGNEEQWEKDGEIEVIGEVKYMRDGALTFIENISKGGNWFGDFRSKWTCFTLNSVLWPWVFVCYRMSQKPRSDRNFLYISPATLNFKLNRASNLEHCINYTVLLETTYCATDAWSNVTWLFSSEHNFKINTVDLLQQFSNESSSCCLVYITYDSSL